MTLLLTFIIAVQQFLDFLQENKENESGCSGFFQQINNSKRIVIISYCLQIYIFIFSAKFSMI